MEYRDFTAKTVDEAITQACLDLGVTSDRLDYSVIQEPSNGFLGIGSKPAIIRARERMPEAEQAISKKEPAAAGKEAVRQEAAVKEEKKEAAPKEEKKIITSDEIEKRAQAAAAKAKSEGRTEETPRPRRQEENRERRGRKGDRAEGRKKAGEFRANREEPQAKPVHHEPSRPKPERVVKERNDEEAAELIKTAEEFLTGVFESMKIKVSIQSEYDKAEGSVNCTFDGEEMGLLIGKRGQTLDSLQYLTSLVVNKNTDDYVRVKLDTEDYRSRRADTLNNLARNISYKVKRSHRPVALEPMNPYERRIIHSALQNNRFVETYSEGEEPYRHVVVAPKR